MCCCGKLVLVLTYVRAAVNRRFLIFLDVKNKQKKNNAVCRVAEKVESTSSSVLRMSEDVAFLRYLWSLQSTDMRDSFYILTENFTHTSLPCQCTACLPYRSL